MRYTYILGCIALAILPSFNEGEMLNKGPSLRIGLGRDGGRSVFRIAARWLKKAPAPCGEYLA